MQGKHDMTFDTQPTSSTLARTTMVGAETWLTGAIPGHGSMLADQAMANPAVPAVDTDPMAVGPVNAAEALAWSLDLGTFSSPRKLTGTDGAELIVDPEKGAYYFESTSLKPLAALLQQTATAWTPVYSVAINATRDSNEAQPLERLRWYAGLIATPGILSRKLHSNGQFKLSRWPETEREYPKHFRIAKEMAREASTLDAIVAASGASRDEVVDYVNASHASGRLATTTTDETRSVDATPTRSQRLIAALNKPLFTRS